MLLSLRLQPLSPALWGQSPHACPPHGALVSAVTRACGAPIQCRMVGLGQTSCRVKVKVLVAQSCPTFCDPMDCSLPGSSVHGILPVRILEWVAIPFSRGSSQSRD